MTRQQKAEAKRVRRAARNLYHPTAHSSYALENLTDRAKGLRQRLALERDARLERVARRAELRKELLAKRKAAAKAKRDKPSAPSDSAAV